MRGKRSIEQYFSAGALSPATFRGKNAMTKFISPFLSACALLLLISNAGAQPINGFHSNPRVFNDFPSSTLTIVNPGTNPDTGSIDDRNFAAASGANRHDILASRDGGASNAALFTGNGFTITTTLTLSDNSVTPRKEAGIRINGGPTGDALFIINSDAGEIVAFGGGAPFHSFGSGATGYVPGTPITMSMRYDPPGIVNPTKGQITYSVNYPTRGLNTSFTGLFDNVEGGPGNGYNFGIYGQGRGADANDFLHLNFANMSASLVPEPASLGLIAMGALALISRRRV